MVNVFLHIFTSKNNLLLFSGMLVIILMFSEYKKKNIEGADLRWQK